MEDDKGQRNDVNKNSMITCRAEEKGNEGNHPRGDLCTWGRYVDNREYPRRRMVDTKTRVALPGAKSYSRLITYSYSGTDIRSHKSTLLRLIGRFIKLSRVNMACRTSSFQLLKP